MRLLQSTQTTEDTVPEDWKTMREIAAELGLSTVHTSHFVRDLGDAVECRKFRIKTGNKVYPVPHYRIKEP